MSKMISVASGFQYSVNIGYDLNNDDKLKNFIPVLSVKLLQQEAISNLCMTLKPIWLILLQAESKTAPVLI